MTTESPVIFLIGAGASCDFGVPDIEGFYDQFKHYLARKKEDYSLLEKLEKRHKERPNLETLIEDLRNLQSAIDITTDVGKVSNELRASAAQAKRLHDLLMSHVIKTCERFHQRRSIRAYRSLLALMEIKSVWFFTTNYDRILEFCCEMCDIPYSDGFVKEKDEPFSVWKVSFDRPLKIAKLHGSINWFRDESDPDAVIKLDEPHPFPSSEFNIGYKNLRLRTSIIIPTFEKYISEFPFLDLEMKFNEAIREAKICFVVGSRLRDLHLRNLLLRNLERLVVIVVSLDPELVKRVLMDHRNVIPIKADFELFAKSSANYLRELLLDIDKRETDELAKEFAEKSRKAIEVAEIEPIEAGPVDELFEGLKSDNYLERAHAARSLGELRVRQAIPLLTTMLDDAHDYVRLQVVSALGLLMAHEAVPKLGEMLLKEPNEDIKVEIVLSLRNIGGSKVEEILTKVAGLPNLSRFLQGI